MDDLALLEQPLQRGKMLTGNLGDLWRFRVGDYRVICEGKGTCLRILVLKVGHRKQVYR